MDKLQTPELETRLVQALAKRGWKIATAESCTGGMVGQRITNVSGSSAVYPGGIISYCNEVKNRLLGVNAQILQPLGPVSEPVAAQMAQGARRVLCTELGVGVTGIAGPNSDESGKPVGLVYVGASDGRSTLVREFHFRGGRAEVRQQAADAALSLCLELLGE